MVRKPLFLSVLCKVGGFQKFDIEFGDFGAFLKTIFIVSAFPYKYDRIFQKKNKVNS